MLALELNQQTLHLCATAADLTPSQMNDVYENANLSNRPVFIVVDYIDEDGETHPVVQMSEGFFRANYEFVDIEKPQAFSEIKSK